MDWKTILMCLGIIGFVFFGLLILYVIIVTLRLKDPIDFNVYNK